MSTAAKYTIQMLIWKWLITQTWICLAWLLRAIPLKYTTLKRKRYLVHCNDAIVDFWCCWRNSGGWVCSKTLVLLHSWSCQVSITGWPHICSHFYLMEVINHVWAIDILITTTVSHHFYPFHRHSTCSLFWSSLFLCFPWKKSQKLYICFVKKWGFRNENTLNCKTEYQLVATRKCKICVVGWGWGGMG